MAGFCDVRFHVSLGGIKKLMITKGREGVSLPVGHRADLIVLDNEIFAMLNVLLVVDALDDLDQWHEQCEHDHTNHHSEDNDHQRFQHRGECGDGVIHFILIHVCDFE